MKLSKVDSLPYQKNRVQREGAFTLVELLVVITLTVVLSLVVISGFKDYRRSQEYQIFVTNIKNGLNETRGKTVGSVGGVTYGVYVGTSSVEFFSGSVPTVGSAANTIVKFPTSMTATSTFSNGKWYMNFERITGGASATGVITVTDSARSESINLSITKTGSIQ